MNIKKQLKSVSIISILCAGFILAPATAYADRHHSDGKQYNKSSQKHSSYSRSKEKHSKRGKPHYNKPHRYNKYRSSPHYSRPKHRPQHSHHRSYAANYYAYPWFLNNVYLDNGGFTIGYQDDHIGFQFRH